VCSTAVIRPEPRPECLGARPATSISAIVSAGPIAERHPEKFLPQQHLIGLPSLWNRGNLAPRSDEPQSGATPMTPTMLPTPNTDWGFWGTISRVRCEPSVQPAEAWTLASATIAATTGATREGLPRQPGWPPLRRRCCRRTRSGRQPDGRDGGCRCALDELAYQSPDEPRDRYPSGSPLPHGRRHPPRDLGRDGPESVGAPAAGT
jgi:hypothetical protein